MKVQFVGEDKGRHRVKATRWYRVVDDKGRTLWGPATFADCHRWKKTQEGR